MERDIPHQVLTAAIEGLFTDLDEERGALGSYPEHSLTRGRAYQAKLNAIASQGEGVRRLVKILQGEGYLIPPETTRQDPA